MHINKIIIFIIFFLNQPIYATKTAKTDAIIESLDLNIDDYKFYQLEKNTLDRVEGLDNSFFHTHFKDSSPIIGKSYFTGKPLLYTRTEADYSNRKDVCILV